MYMITWLTKVFLNVIAANCEFRETWSCNSSERCASSYIHSNCDHSNSPQYSLPAMATVLAPSRTILSLHCQRLAPRISQSIPKRAVSTLPNNKHIVCNANASQRRQQANRRSTFMSSSKLSLAHTCSRSSPPRLQTARSQLVHRRRILLLPKLSPKTPNSSNSSTGRSKSMPRKIPTSKRQQPCTHLKLALH